LLSLPSRRSTLGLCAELAALLGPGDLVVLSGPLGTGKTFFVRGLLRRRGLASDERVTSPTFSLVQDFDLSPRVVHADLYRLSRPVDVRELGLLHERRQGSLLLVEWGAPFVAELGADALQLAFERIAGAERGRRVEVSADGPRSRELLAALASRMPHARGA
jgi:tRNA threonylcarbamoyl adenosine modification protein YjeE